MKKTVRFHRGDSPFKMKTTSPLKDGGGEEKGTDATSSKTTRKAVDEEGNLVNATTKRTHYKEVKKSAQNRQIGTNVADIKGKAIKSKKLEGYGLTHPKARAKSNAALAEAQKKDEENAPSSESASAKNTIETTHKQIPTPGVRGTSNDVFSSGQKRKAIREEKITNRGERQEGKQELRKDRQYMKHTKEWADMSGSERASAKKELRQGGGETIKSKFGEDMNTDVATSHKKRWGQGELNKARVKEAEETPGQRVAAEKAQNIENKNAGSIYGKGRLSTETNYGEGNKKHVEASPTTKASEEDKKRLPVSIEGSTSSETSNDSTSSESKGKNFSQYANKVASSLFQNKGNQNNPTASSKEKPTTTPVEGAQKKNDTTDVKSVANMTRKASGFSMRGFGAKAGFNFNNKK